MVSALASRSLRNISNRLALASLLLIFACAIAPASDLAAGRKKALQCQACHGLDGLSKRPDAPNLAGQPEPFLIKALNDFRNGARKNEMMSITVKTLTDSDVADLAAYYSAIKISVGAPH
jgi:cytochrome c553